MKRPKIVRLKKDKSTVIATIHSLVPCPGTMVANENKIVLNNGYYFKLEEFMAHYKFQQQLLGK